MSSETEALKAARNALPEHEQMRDAQSQCVPCKLCGGMAVISDAGIGAGFYIRCQNSGAFRAYNGCMVNDVRLGGWAYNVMDWWNRLHTTGLRATTSEEEAQAVILANRVIGRIDNFLAKFGGFNAYAAHADNGTTTGWSQLRSEIWLATRTAVLSSPTPVGARVGKPAGEYLDDLPAHITPIVTGMSDPAPVQGALSHATPTAASADTLQNQEARS